MSISQYLLLILLTVVSRILPRLLRPHTVCSDTYYHLLRAEKIRNNGFRLPVDDHQLRLFGGLYYPPIYHYILALFPRERRTIAERYLGPICDALLVLIGLWFIESHVDGLSGSTLFYLGCAIALNPLFTYCGNGPRAYAGTARILGQLFFNLSIVSLLLYLKNIGLVYLVLFALSGALVLLTSRFGAQAWAFTMIGISLITGDLRILIYMMIVTLCVMAVSKGSYVRILKAHIDHLLNHIAYDKCIDSVFEKRGRSANRDSFQDRLQLLIFHNYYFIYVSRNLFFLALMAVTAIYWYTYSSAFGGASKALWAWIIVLQVVSLATSRKTLLFLGEAERYLEYAVLPIMAVLASVILSLYPQRLEQVLMVSVFAYCVPYYVIQLIIYMKWDKEYSGGQEYEHAIDQLKKMANPVILPIIRDQPWRTAYLTNHTVAAAPKDMRPDDSQKGIDQFYLSYPWPHTDLGRYVRDHCVDVVLAEKKLLTKLSNQGIVYNWTGFKKIYDNHCYEIYAHS